MKNTSNYHFRNLVFEGGGVKGIAYCGALQVIEEKGILKDIRRTAGTSAGAITAGLLAVGYSTGEILQLLSQTSFKNFMDSYWGFLRDTIAFFRYYGWYKGNYFKRWFENLIEQKTGDKNLTFRQLYEKSKLEPAVFRELVVTGTNLNTRSTEIFSAETSPDLAVAQAIRISMSIPAFFRVVRWNRTRYADGGLFYNYPINIFDNARYLEDPAFGKPAPYDSRPGSAFNCQTLGFRVDTRDEIEGFAHPPVARSVNSLKDFLLAIVSGYLEGMNRRHLHKNDWHRTIFIDSLGIKTTQFDLTQQEVNNLVASGRQGAAAYFQWFDNPDSGQEAPLNKI